MNLEELPDAARLLPDSSQRFPDGGQFGLRNAAGIYAGAVMAPRGADGRGIPEP
jgi:hypothetical protein